MKFKILLAHALKRTYIPLRFKLAASHTLIALLPICIIYLISYNIFCKSLLKETCERITSVVSDVTQKIDKGTGDMQKLLSNVTGDKHIKEVTENPQWIIQNNINHKIDIQLRISDMFKNMTLMNEDIKNIGILPLRGISVIYFDNRTTIGFLAEQPPWYSKVVKADEETFIGPHAPLPPSTSPDYVFSVANAVRDSSGNILSTAFVDLKTSFISNLINSASDTNKIRICILDANNSFIFKSDNMYEENFIDSGMIVKINSARSSTFDYTYKNRDYIIFTDTCNVTGWKTIAITEVNYMLAYANMVKNVILLVGGFAFLLSIFVSILFAFMITKPIRALDSSFEEVRKKNFNIFLKTSSNDEIGRLTSNFNSMIRYIRNLITKEYESDLRSKESELRALESQVNPHFLYNTLETINSIAYLNEVPEIMEISKDLSDIFRYSIKSDTRFVSLREELYYSNSYINIQKIRLGDKFNVVYEIPEKLKGYQVVKLIMQPLIENSISHGFELMEEGGIITITAKIQDDNLILTVRDNGIGFSPKKLESLQESLNESPYINTKAARSRIGLSNVHFRIKNYYGKGYGLTIESEYNTGTTITLKMPAIMAEYTEDQNMPAL